MAKCSLLCVIGAQSVLDPLIYTYKTSPALTTLFTKTINKQGFSLSLNPTPPPLTSILNWDDPYLVNGNRFEHFHAQV
jgi:hypothetical protein